MLRLFAKPIPLVLGLWFCTAIGVLVAAALVVQILIGAVPDGSLRLMVVPYSTFLHALSGVLFGVLGPLQFGGVVRRRFGRWHRLTGRVFAVAGLGLGLSGLSMLAQVDSLSTPLLDVFRGLAGVCVAVAVTVGVAAARARNMMQHRAWMIRAYAIGMGASTIALVMFPIFLATGAPLRGFGADVVFVVWWSANVALGEWVIRRGGAARRPGAIVPS